MRHARHWQATGWALLAAFVLTQAAGAAPRSGPSQDTVAVTILGVRATKETNEHVDPPLRPIADELKRSKYNCFRLAVSDTKNVTLGETWELPLIEDYAVRIQPEKETADTVRLVLSWIRYEKAKDGKRRPRTLLKVPLAIRKGKYLLSGGWKLKDGALLGAVAVQ